LPTTTTRQDREISRLLLGTIPHMMRSVRLAMRDAKRSRLTVPQFRVLGCVSLAPCTGKQLADWQGVSVPAISRMVDCLVRRQLLLRTPDTADRRQVQLRPTQKGRKEFQRLHESVQARLAERIATLDAPKKKSLKTGLTILGELFSEI